MLNQAMMVVNSLVNPQQKENAMPDNRPISTSFRVPQFFHLQSIDSQGSQQFMNGLSLVSLAAS